MDQIIKIIIKAKGWTINNLQEEEVEKKTNKDDIRIIVPHHSDNIIKLQRTLGSPHPFI